VQVAAQIGMEADCQHDAFPSAGVTYVREEARRPDVVMNNGRGLERGLSTQFASPPGQVGVLPGGMAEPLVEAAQPLEEVPPIGHVAGLVKTGFGRHLKGAAKWAAGRSLAGVRQRKSLNQVGPIEGVDQCREPAGLWHTVIVGEGHHWS
jgi:hypothetical protein